MNSTKKKLGKAARVEQSFDCSPWTITAELIEESRKHFELEEDLRKQILILDLSELQKSAPAKKELEERLKAFDTPVTENTLRFSVR